MDTNNSYLRHLEYTRLNETRPHSNEGWEILKESYNSEATLENSIGIISEVYHSLTTQDCNHMESIYNNSLYAEWLQKVLYPLGMEMTFRIQPHYKELRSKMSLTEWLPTKVNFELTAEHYYQIVTVIDYLLLVPLSAKIDSERYSDFCCMKEILYEQASYLRARDRIE